MGKRKEKKRQPTKNHMEKSVINLQIVITKILTQNKTLWQCQTPFNNLNTQFKLANISLFFVTRVLYMDFFFLIKSGSENRDCFISIKDKACIKILKMSWPKGCISLKYTIWFTLSTLSIIEERVPLSNTVNKPHLYKSHLLTYLFNVRNGGLPRYLQLDINPSGQKEIHGYRAIRCYLWIHCPDVKDVCHSRRHYEIEAHS